MAVTQQKHPYEQTACPFHTLHLVAKTVFWKHSTSSNHPKGGSIHLTLSHFEVRNRSVRGEVVPPAHSRAAWLHGSAPGVRSFMGHKGPYCLHSIFLRGNIVWAFFFFPVSGTVNAGISL